jgi:hypothetical protein
MTGRNLRLESPPHFSFKSSKMLLCIDFQPAYAESFSDLMEPLRIRLREAVRRGEEIHFVYNEAWSLEGESLGNTLEEVLEWCDRESLPVRGARMIRKNFGWVSHLFRDGFERKIAIDMLRLFMERSISCSADISREEQERIVASSHDHFSGFWDCSTEAWEEITTGAIAMPYLFEGGITNWLESLRGTTVEVIGGFRHRCLDEMCMMMEAGSVPHRLNEALVYSFNEEAESPAWEDPEQTTQLLFPSVSVG